jgi:hypothetical protein
VQGFMPSGTRPLHPASAGGGDKPLPYEGTTRGGIGVVGAGFIPARSGFGGMA